MKEAINAWSPPVPMGAAVVLDALPLLSYCGCMDRNGHSEVADTRERVLFRQMGPGKTFRFVICIQIERSGEEFISTVAPLEPGTVIAAGTTADEAEMNAVDVFCTMVDHCLAAGQLAEFLGGSEIMYIIDVSFEDLLPSPGSEFRCERHRPDDADDTVEITDIPKPWVVGRQYDTNAESCEE